MIKAVEIRRVDRRQHGCQKVIAHPKDREPLGAARANVVGAARLHGIQLNRAGPSDGKTIGSGPAAEGARVGSVGCAE